MGVSITDIEVTYKAKALLQQVKAIINLDKVIIEYDREKHGDGSNVSKIPYRLNSSLVILYFEL